MKHQNGGDPEYEGVQLLSGSIDSPGSDSDGPEFPLPTKRPRSRKRTSTKQRPSDQTCCGAWIVLKVLLFALLCGCIATLAWLMYSTKLDLDNLRERFKELENQRVSEPFVEADSKGNSGEYGALRTDVEKIQEDIESVTKSENEKIQKIQSDLNDILSQITLLNKTTKSLSESVSSASELLALPTTVASLQQSVAKMGSDLTSLQAKVDTVESAERQTENTVDVVRTDVESVKERLDGMELSVMTQGNQEKEVAPPTLAPLLKALTTPTPAHELVAATEQVQATGQSATGDISAVQNYLQQEIDRVGLDVEDLNSTIVTLQSQYNNLISRVTLIETGVTAPASMINESTNIDIQEMYNNLHNLMNLLQQNVTSSDEVELDKDSLKELEEEIQNMTDMVLALRERVNQLNPNDLNNNLLNPNTTRGLQVILDKTANKIRSDNKAMMDGFQSNINNLWNQFAQQSGTVASIQRDVSQVKELVNSLAHNTDGLGGLEPSQIPPNSEVSPQNIYQAASEPNVPTGGEVPNPDYNPEIANPELYPQNPDGLNTSHQETGTVGDQAINTASMVPTVKPNQTDLTNLNMPTQEHITLGGIYSSEDLLNHFLLWDHDGDDLVSYPDLQTFYGPALPPQETLNAYDLDLNGKFDRDELGMALGFLDMLEQPVTGGQPSQIAADHHTEPQQDIGQKPGSCPTVPPGTVGVCGEYCSSDLNCDGASKCCSNGCGHTCMQPVIPTLPTTVTEKPGSCPAVALSQVGECVEYCTSDADCGGDTKCCSNGCGHKCMPPVLEPVEGAADDDRLQGSNWGSNRDEKYSQYKPYQKPQYPSFPHYPEKTDPMQEWKEEMKQQGLYPNNDNSKK